MARLVASFVRAPTAGSRAATAVWVITRQSAWLTEPARVARNTAYSAMIRPCSIMKSCRVPRMTNTASGMVSAASMAA